MCLFIVFLEMEIGNMTVARKFFIYNLSREKSALKPLIWVYLSNSFVEFC